MFDERAIFRYSNSIEYFVLLRLRRKMYTENGPRCGWWKEGPIADRSECEREKERKITRKTKPKENRTMRIEAWSVCTHKTVFDCYALLVSHASTRISNDSRRSDGYIHRIKIEHWKNGSKIAWPEWAVCAPFFSNRHHFKEEKKNEKKWKLLKLKRN